MTTYRIDAKFKNRILVPNSAIENSLDFMFCNHHDNITVQTNDGREGKLVYHKMVNIISDEGIKLLSDVYPSYTPFQFLRMWYQRCDECMYSLEFQYIELNEINNTVPVPAKAD